MYSTCLFCHASLGGNEAIESFPVGRRLAFDAEKGRLWVVCRKCARWNLTPIEERWEAIEECERAFSSTRLRVSTDNVGLARLSEGLELVRIGRPQRPEFAAWRYGDQFGRRRRRYLMYSGALSVAGVSAFVAGPVLGLAIGGAVNSVAILVNLFAQTRVRARIAVPEGGRPAVVRQAGLGKISILSDGDAWRIRMPLDSAVLTGPDRDATVTLEGEAALRGAATILSVSNDAGANDRRLRAALDVVSETPDAAALFIDTTRKTWKVDQGRNRWTLQERAGTGKAEMRLIDIPPEIRLALEMATNEDIERRAMEGELAILEEAWRQADEIAAIADHLPGELPGAPTRSEEHRSSQKPEAGKE
jgi:hypothetical protein